MARQGVHHFNILHRMNINSLRNRLLTCINPLVSNIYPMPYGSPQVGCMEIGIELYSNQLYVKSVRIILSLFSCFTNCFCTYLFINMDCLQSLK